MSRDESLEGDGRALVRGIPRPAASDIQQAAGTQGALRAPKGLCERERPCLGADETAIADPGPEEAQGQSWKRSRSLLAPSLASRRVVSTPKAESARGEIFRR